MNTSFVVEFVDLCHFSLLQDVVYDKPKTLDSTFDARGDTASTLIAVSNMCEFINIQTILGKCNAWKRDKLHFFSIPGSSTMMLQYGISGSFWYIRIKNKMNKNKKGKNKKNKNKKR